MERIPMTAAGFKALEDEINHLKTVERPTIIKMIAEARAHGDLSENAEYHAAKERQGFIEGRVMELEDKIGRAEVIDVSKLSGTSVKFGATVTLVDEDTEAKAQIPDRRRSRSRREEGPDFDFLADRARADRQDARAIRWKSRRPAARGRYEILKVEFV